MRVFQKGRLVSVLLTIVLVLGLLGNGRAEAATASDRYTYYNASSILKRYQVFVRNDFTAYNHLIGAIAVGGTYKGSNFFGDVATAPSFIKNWQSGGLGTGAVNSGLVSYLSNNGFSVNRVIHYGGNAPVSAATGWEIVKNPNYIDMEAAFSSLRSQSKALAERGSGISGNTVDLTNANSDVYITIPASKLNSLNIRVPSYSWFRSHTLVISVSDGGTVSFNGWSIKVNGSDIGNNFRSSFPGKSGQYDVQLNCTGMNLFWNFPNATRVNVQGMGGHLIAPNAHVENNSGNYEGGIIAKSLTTSSEGHFYPCNRQLPRDNSDLKPSPTVAAKPTEKVTPSLTPEVPTPTKEITKTPEKKNTPSPTPEAPTPTKEITKTPDRKVTPTQAPDRKNTPSPTPEAPTPTKEITKTPDRKVTPTQAPVTPTPGPQGESTPTPEVTETPTTPSPTPYRRPTATPTPVGQSDDISIRRGADGDASGDTYGEEGQNGRGVFSKETVDGSELAGALLMLTSVNRENDLSKITRTKESGGRDYKPTRNRITWTSTEEPTVLQDLPNGVYRLHENCAPAGYDVASDMYFRMIDGVICDLDGVPFKNGVLVMVDTTLSDPGYSSSQQAQVPPAKNAAGSQVHSPQTSEQIPAAPVLAALVVMILLTGIGVIITISKKEKKRC
ncbi:MAG: choice-of-anchor A family protein [Lachnospiraceae bacterium]|nr:choice-of-anchor A family protein [Lachnospiraceae bacterium]